MKLWIVLHRYGTDDPWMAHQSERGGLAVGAHMKKANADHEASKLRFYRSRGCVKVVAFTERAPATEGQPHD